MNLTCLVDLAWPTSNFKCLVIKLLIKKILYKKKKGKCDISNKSKGQFIIHEIENIFLSLYLQI